MASQAYDFGNTLSEGFEGMFDEGRGYQMAVLKFSDVKVSEQVRKEMEDESSTLEEMGGSILKHGYLQTMLVRPIDGPIPYELVAGERRIVSGSRAGETEGPFLIKEMTDAEKADIQFAENIHRKNLTQIEEAQKIQFDLNELGSVEAVLAKHNKGRAWLSKIMSLLSLPEQAKRVVSEQISADVEVIGMVKTVEKIDPAAAKVLVDELKATRGKVDARQLAEKAKDAVKPPKPKKEGTKATPKDQAHKEPGSAKVIDFAGAKTAGETLSPAAAWPFPGGGKAAGMQPEEQAAAGPGPALPPATLARAYGSIYKEGVSPQKFLDSLAKQDRDDVSDWLEAFYTAGRDAGNVAQGVIQGLRKDTFGTEGAGAFAMLAFLQGADAAVKHFNVLNVLGLAKA
jgi:ParB family chromosome partitioning protein